MNRAALGMVAVLSLPISIGLLALDARSRRLAHIPDEHAASAVVQRLPSSDLALSGGARWLRMPALEEPGAAFSDGPGMPDPDPAGGAISPPRAVWAAEAALRREKK